MFGTSYYTKEDGVCTASCLSFMDTVVMLANDQAVKSQRAEIEAMTLRSVGCARIPDGTEQQLKSAHRVVRN